MSKVLENIEHRTSNIEHRTEMVWVSCSRFKVQGSKFKVPLPVKSNSNGMTGFINSAGGLP